jgi:hypothetical protein
MITEEVEKNPTEKWINIAKCLRLVPSTLNSNVAKKREIQKMTSVIHPVIKGRGRQT